ncbi:hypothetical protein Pmani_033574 [Petrolisthes manimaculis]|uniref:Uncharacterized protein n=1 Tax=Petrolisthes manimaculis TaxID=1843537 RepID=A0AAE1NR45_9EUCA|nr:hypothetical protein Pmani_033574 [Petrolisthes manimaculis]
MHRDVTSVVLRGGIPCRPVPFSPTERVLPPLLLVRHLHLHTDNQGAVASMGRPQQQQQQQQHRGRRGSSHLSLVLHIILLLQVAAVHAGNWM